MSKKGGELLNTSQLSERANLDRAVVAKRLREKGVRPKDERPKLKLYDAEEALAALQGDDRTGLRKAQTMKTAVEASRAKIKLEKERGELVPIRDVREDLQRIIKRIHQHFAVNGPRDLAPRLGRLKAREFEAALKGDAEKFFNELRAEYESYL